MGKAEKEEYIGTDPSVREMLILRTDTGENDLQGSFKHALP